MACMNANNRREEKDDTWRGGEDALGGSEHGQSPSSLGPSTGRQLSARGRRYSTLLTRQRAEFVRLYADDFLPTGRLAKRDISSRDRNLEVFGRWETTPTTPGPMGRRGASLVRKHADEAIWMTWVDRNKASTQGFLAVRIYLFLLIWYESGQQNISLY